MGDLRDRVRATNCGSWTELIRQLESLSYARNDNTGDHWIYRGHADAGWWLKPSIELFRDSLTAPTSPYTIRDLENQLLYDFQSVASQFLGNLPASGEILEWLSILQHYGTPTRLLDWTYSPTVAAYFALREKPNVQKCDPGGHACVWAVNLGKLKRLLMQKVEMTNWGDAYTKALGDVRENPVPGYVTPFLPRNLYSRMSGQQGLFLVNTDSEQPFMTTLDGMCSLDDDTFVRRFLVPHSERVVILAHLLEHNTHEVALFPDADGLGRFVRIKVEIQAQTLGLS